MSEAKKSIVDVLKFLGLGAIKLDFIRPAIFKFGGRKAGLAGLGVAAIVYIVKLCIDAKIEIGVGIGLLGVGIGLAASLGAIAIAIEDNKKNGGEK